MEAKVSSMGLAMIIVVIGVFDMMTIQVNGSPRGIAEAPAELTAPAPSPAGPAIDVYIVYTEKPTEEAKPEPFYLKLLTTALGSETTAKEALLYVYKSVGSAFTATLTPQQVDALKKTPGVVDVVPSSSQTNDDNHP